MVLPERLPTARKYLRQRIYRLAAWQSETIPAPPLQQTDGLIVLGSNAARDPVQIQTHCIGAESL
jgi:hypothetical protein